MAEFRVTEAKVARKNHRIPKKSLVKNAGRLKSPLKKTGAYCYNKVVTNGIHSSEAFMLERKIYNKLLEWKNDPNHTPLVVKGCRQCGKTFSVLDFAQNNYAHTVYINFFENPDYKDIFSGSLEVDHLTMMMSALLGSTAVFTPGETVIILDELQECPAARTALKFFCLDGRYDVIATGSLLGVSGYNSAPASIPVGYETVVDMYPLDFEEFIMACGINSQAISLLRQCLNSENEVPASLHNRMRQLLLQYVVVGGMPAVVQSFITSRNINHILQLQRNIVRSYGDDMIKYADTPAKSSIRDCFLSIPRQLAKENKKFQYSLIKKGGTSAKFGDAIRWIEDAGIIRVCHNLSITELPLEGNAIQDIFKVYMADTGLFVSMLEDGTQGDILSGKLLGYKGAIFENIIADIFGKMGRQLYYFRKDSGLDLDFVIRYRGECTPVEVKATNGNAKSLKTVMQQPERYHVNNAIKMGNFNINRNGKILNLPLYMAFLLDER